MKIWGWIALARGPLANKYLWSAAILGVVVIGHGERFLGSHIEVLVEDVVVSDAEGGSEEIVVVEELDETPVTEEEA